MYYAILAGDIVFANVVTGSQSILMYVYYAYGKPANLRLVSSLLFKIGNFIFGYIISLYDSIWKHLISIKKVIIFKLIFHVIHKY